MKNQTPVTKKPEKHGKPGECYVLYRDMAALPEVVSAIDSMAAVMISDSEGCTEESDAFKCRCKWKFCEIFYRNAESVFFNESVINAMRSIKEKTVMKILGDFSIFGEPIKNRIFERVIPVRNRLSEESIEVLDNLDDFITIYASELKGFGEDLVVSREEPRKNPTFLSQVEHFVRDVEKMGRQSTGSDSIK